MLALSLVGMMLGPLVQQMHLIDWWHPNFVFNTPIKLEDILLGFSVPGVAIATYDILRSSVVARQNTVPFVLKILLASVTTLLLFGLFCWFGVSSFWSSIISLCVPICFIAVVSPQLILPMVLTGVFLVILAVPGYLFGIYLNPHWIQNEWLLSNLSGRFVLGIPIEELLWFFFAGVGLSASKEILFSPTHRRNQRNADV